MDLRQLHQFVTVAEAQSFRRAAERLFMAQPPLSVAIRKLEEEIGTPLFERSARGVRLTAAGESALVAARKCLAGAQDVATAARAAAGGETGHLRIGFTGSATFGLLPRAIQAFSRRYPEVRLTLQEMTNQQLLSLVQAQQLDLGFVRVPTSRPPGVHFEVLERDVLCVALHPDHPLAGKAALSLRDLADQDFVGYVPSPVGGLHAAATSLLQKADVAPHITQEAVQVATVIGLVGSGLGLALVPSANTRYYTANVVYRPLNDLPRGESIGIALVHRPDSSNPAVRHFLSSVPSLTRSKKRATV
ncbi:LysR family transcriptional regulator [Polaromonas jejuensis]|uniref:LysR family transcriptional regulator n=1 Tax=Polaromonas jejuensis TaxID=457502 RepID=A0ABW0QAZ5_9BURK|nr:LysR family transcriptional regulator [Polaromonas jejuensis]